MTRGTILASLFLASGCGTSSDPPAACAPPSSDVVVKAGFPDLPVRDCDGAPIQIATQTCGAKAVLVDIGTAAFPECVKKTDDYASGPDYDELQAKGLRIVQVFVQDTGGGPPTSTFCRQYTAAHGVDFPFFVDPSGATEALAGELPFVAVLDARGAVVAFWRGVHPDDDELRDALDGALGL